MKHYLQPGDRIYILTSAKVFLNNHAGISWSPTNDFADETPVFVYDEQGERHECKWDEDGYYWED
jgi:hypothetical protein